ncbi:MAG: saccharopine dehydrogenase-like oxidoreductase [Pseudanabaenaceae cyanobacterium]
MPTTGERSKMINVGILGLGGLGKAAAQVLSQKQEMRLVAVCDRSGYAYDPQGLDYRQLTLTPADNGIQILQQKPIDAFFLALPNLPNTFMAEVAEDFSRSGWRGVLVDALKRTSAMEQILALNDQLQQSQITYMTGCGATPGLLTAAAVVAAQSFSEVHKVEIRFGVGIANWTAYRATIREDIAHMPGYDLEKAKAMTDAEIEALLEQTNGILTLENMEHADDLMLERLGICHRSQVTVGGIVDTRNPKKPISTHMKLTGRTFEGKIATHTFTLGDETSMAANVCGPAFGYLKAGKQLHDRGIYGVFTAAEVMPQFVR